MGIFKNLRNLFGSSRPTQDDSHANSEFENQLKQSVEAFKNRPIHKELTAELIDATSDNDLIQVVFDNLTEKVPNDYEKEYESVMSWNKSRQATYMTWLLESEVNNGGYNQFYSNSSGQFAEHLPEALTLIGSHAFAKLMEEANRTFKEEFNQITKHQDGTIEGFSKSYENNPLNKLDTQFYELYKQEDLLKIQIEYIRNTKADFTAK